MEGDVPKLRGSQLLMVANALHTLLDGLER